MQNRCCECVLEQIFVAWASFESNDRKIVEKELQHFTEVCNMYFNLATNYFGKYKRMYDQYIKATDIELPKITEFLIGVKNASQEAYEFLTEGHDIINFKEYIAFHERNIENGAKELYVLIKFADFIEHTFLKILNEPSQAKKQVMLRGLVGL